MMYTLSENVQARLKGIGLDAETWHALKTVPVMELVFADEKETPDERARLEAMYSGSKLAFAIKQRDPTVRKTALDLLKDILTEAPPEESVKIREDVGKDIARFLQGRGWKQLAVKAGVYLRKAFLTEFSQQEQKALKGVVERLQIHEVMRATLAQSPYLQSTLSDFMTFDTANSTKAVKEMKPTIREIAPPLREFTQMVPDNSPCNVSRWLWDAISPSVQRAAEIRGLIEKSRDLIVRESQSPGFSLERVKVLSDLSAIHASATVFDGGVGFLSPEAAEGKQIFVIGDLHGDFQSLTAVLRTTQFFERLDVMLVFLGDYVDRGAGTIPVLLRVLEMKLAYPDRIVLLKGNHDGIRPQLPTGQAMPNSEDLAKIYPDGWTQNSPPDSNPEYSLISGIARHIAPFFTGACEDKWKAYSLLKDIFDHLPVCLLLHDGTFLTHGGIIPRTPNQFDPSASLPGGYSVRIARGSIADGFEEKISVQGICDLRKPHVQSFMLSIRLEEQQFAIMLWGGEECRGYDFGDVQAFFALIGATQLIRGHDPVNGYREYPDCPGLYTLHTTRSLDNAGFRCTPHIAHWKPNARPVFINIETVCVR